MSSFIHLKTRSAYSLLRGAIKTDELVAFSLKNQQPAIALTDFNNMFGALEFSTYAFKNGIQPIIGSEVLVKFNDTIGTLTLLVCNEIGYKNLTKLVSELYLNPNRDLQDNLYLDFQKVCELSEGLICLTGYSTGVLGILLNNFIQKKSSNEDESLEFFHTLHNTFKDRLYIEIQRHGFEFEKDLEAKHLELAYKYNVAIVATNDCYFLDSTCYEAHDALMCIANGQYVAQDDREKLTPEHYLKTSIQMQELFEDLPEAIEQSVQIARRCHFSPLTSEPMLPNFPTTNGKTEAQELLEQAQIGLNNRFLEDYLKNHKDHSTLKIAYEKRLNYEFDIINQMGFCGYFLIVSDFIKWAKNQNIPVGPGRGSGAGSLIAWVLSITDLDPIRFDLLFERFLNPERVSMPDFDVDFCQDRRDEVINYVKEKYGADRVAHIITFGKLQARAVLRDVGRVLQIPYPVVDKFCKLIPNNPANPLTLEQALEVEPLLKQNMQEDAAISHMVEIGRKLEGLYRHASTHAAGVVISNKPLVETLPLFKDEGSQLPATQFNMKYSEMSGLVKFDFLGLKTLSIIENASKIVRDKFDSNFYIQKISLDDPKTFELLAAGKVMGVFQVEGPGMRDVLKKMQPDRLEDIIVLISLYRPGPMDYIPTYLARKHNLEKVIYLHDSLEPILKNTYGVMVYQEQVMKIAQELAGYTLGGADLLRRAMGKKIKEEMDAQKQKFIDGAASNGIKQDVSDKIFEQMAKFAGYAFNKSHAAAYALITYQTAYLKAHYPAAFFASCMSADKHNTDKISQYKTDMQKMDVELLAPCINSSFADFTIHDKKSVKFGLSAIKNVGIPVIEAITSIRTKPFSDLFDCLNKIAPHINKRMLEGLICSGAFDSLYVNRRSLYESIEQLSALGSKKAQSQTKQLNLFNLQNKQLVELKDVIDWDILTKLQKELEALGFYFSTHPLNIYQDQLKQFDIIKSIDLEAVNQNEKIKIAGVVLTSVTKLSKTGNKFAFAAISDTFGNFEIALFKDVYEKYNNLLTVGNILIIDAVLKKDNERSKLIVNKISKVDDLHIIRELILDVKSFRILKGIVEELKNIENGNCNVSIKLNKEMFDQNIVISNIYKNISLKHYQNLNNWCASE